MLVSLRGKRVNIPLEPFKIDFMNVLRVLL